MGMSKARSGKSHLAKLAYAHKPSRPKQTPRKEDYAEIIYELIREKGYAKPVDIANHLHVTAPSVTIMLNKLREERVIIHEKYGGIILTEKGRSMAQRIGARHATLVSFLRLFGVEEPTAQKDTEGLEHYVDSKTLELLGGFVEYVRLNPEWWNEFRKSQKKMI